MEDLFKNPWIKVLAGSMAVVWAHQRGLLPAFMYSNKAEKERIQQLAKANQ